MKSAYFYNPVFYTLLFLCLGLNGFAQKPYQVEKAMQPPIYTPQNVSPPESFRAITPAASQIFNKTSTKYKALPPLQKEVPTKATLRFGKDSATELPLFIKGRLPLTADANAPVETKAIAYMDALKTELRVENPAQEFKTLSQHTDDIGHSHIKMQQYINGIKVYGGQVLLHARNSDISSFNGRYYPTPEIENFTATVSKSGAENIVRQDLPNFKDMGAMELALLHTAQQETELVIYHIGKNHDQETLAWHSRSFPHLAEQWEYFIDAHTGAILHKFIRTCQFHSTLDKQHIHDNNCTAHHSHKKDTNKSATVDGPATANATDLFGNTVLINTYEVDGTYFMYDGSRNMFNPTQSNLPEEPVGMIVTIDGMNTYPGNDNFVYEVITSSNNSWNTPSGVSAHRNAGLAYAYFEDTHQRNAINGQGGTIYSLINIADENGQPMDNAFWNGQAMFYGNGNQAFTSPLAKALDVAGHEMSHGVVQTTANLEYQGQSGALNESFADIFGAMIDRDDWQMGEDITNPNVFPSGALRDLANPNNGGSQLGDPGWQPAHMNEIYNGSQDNGGVHINSGIVNRAFYLFANNVGKDVAEKIYYKALADYLTMSSQFTDARYAVVTAAEEIHGSGSSQATAAASAFESVGIPGVGPGDYEQDAEINPGEDYILSSDAELGALYIDQPDGTSVFFPLTGTDILSRPSVTDDGTAFVFIGADNKLYGFTIDWETNETDEFLIQDEAIWRNVAISKDGNRLAALTTDFNNEVWIYDYGIGGAWQIYELYNPTFTEGVNTGDVLYADILEFDLTGEYLLYDAFNRIDGTGDNQIEYWDIGYQKVWNNTVGNYGNGEISKLFSGLPENVSIGNPTFSKNSPHIIAFDYIDQINNNYTLKAVNIETGNQGTFYVNEELNYPNYSRLDDVLIFDAINTNNEQVLGMIGVGSDKISPVGDPSQLILGGKWGVWLAQGERDLTDIETPIEQAGLKVYPSPFDANLNLKLELENREMVVISLSDLLGRKVLDKKLDLGSGQHQESLNLTRLANGTYLLQVRIGERVVTKKVEKVR